MVILDARSFIYRNNASLKFKKYIFNGNNYITNINTFAITLIYSFLLTFNAIKTCKSSKSKQVIILVLLKLQYLSLVN